MFNVIVFVVVLCAMFIVIVFVVWAFSCCRSSVVGFCGFGMFVCCHCFVVLVHAVLLSGVVHGSCVLYDSCCLVC